MKRRLQLLNKNAVCLAQIDLIFVAQMSTYLFLFIRVHLIDMIVSPLIIYDISDCEG